MKLKRTVGAVALTSASTVVALATASPAGAAPVPVQGLAATPSRAAISLSWLNPGGTFSGVVIRRATGSAPPTQSTGTQVASLSRAESTYTDIGLAPATTYSYTVFARDGAAVGAPVSKTVATTNSGGVPPVLQPNASQVTADALPTVQIDGVVWSQAVIGNTVYAGGSFKTARPAGASPGKSTVSRANLLAFDLVTGALKTGFVAQANAQVLAVAAAPDGSKLYVGGDFTTINGVSRSRFAALNPATGTPIAGFAGSVNGQVRAITATTSTVYVGGRFGIINGAARARIAAVSAANGAVTTWHPSVGDGGVSALVLTPDKSKLVLGGYFTVVNNTTQYGTAAVSATTGVTAPWKVNQKLQDGGTYTDNRGSSNTSLTTDGVYVYGTGYNFGVKHQGSYEGTWAASPADGSLVWLEDCHGDTYSAFPVGGVVYSATHAHECIQEGGWGNLNPQQHRNLMAWSRTPNGFLGPWTQGGNYTNWAGTPGPSLFHFFPDFLIGSYTGMNQAVWNLTGNSSYLVGGGEFVQVNNKSQQGLVRFAIRGTAGNAGAQAPRYSGSEFTPKLTRSGRNVTVAFQTTWDRDDVTVTYRVYRNNVLVWTRTADSLWWKRPSLSFVDANRPAGSYSYYVTATDPHGIKTTGPPASITVT